MGAPSFIVSVRSNFLSFCRLMTVCLTVHKGLEEL
jgi:hypothetical protein